MKKITILLFMLGLLSGSCNKDLELTSEANEFFHLEENSAFIPIMVRGNTASGKILLYIQGGPALNTLDFAYVDYAGWKETLERDYAIAYYDQRGMGNTQGHLGLESVTIDQYLTDLRKIIQLLQDRYPGLEIYLFGHSWGGWLSYLYLQTFSGQPLVAGAIAMDAPFTTDQEEIRWTFRHRFLLNTAKEFIEAGKDIAYWEEARQWALDHPILDDKEEKRQWNYYVYNGLSEYEVEVPIRTGAIFKVLFGSSYSLFPSLLNTKKWDAVSDRLFADMKTISLLDHLEKIQVPILLITGRYDDIAPPEELEFGLEKIGSAQKWLEVLPDSGHDSFLNQPELFRESIRTFIN